MMSLAIYIQIGSIACCIIKDKFYHLHIVKLLSSTVTYTILNGLFITGFADTLSSCYNLFMPLIQK